MGTFLFADKLFVEDFGELDHFGGWVIVYEVWRGILWCLIEVEVCCDELVMSLSMRAKNVHDRARALRAGRGFADAVIDGAGERGYRPYTLAVHMTLNALPWISRMYGPALDMTFNVSSLIFPPCTSAADPRATLHHSSSTNR